MGINVVFNYMDYVIDGTIYTRTDVIWCYVRYFNVYVRILVCPIIVGLCNCYTDYVDHLIMHLG